MDLASESKMNSEGGEGRPGEVKWNRAWIQNKTNSYSKVNMKTFFLMFKTVYVLFPLVPPTSLPLQGGATQRKKLSAPRISLSLDQSEDDLGETPDDLDINVDDLDTPDEGDYLDYTDHEMDWEGGSFRRKAMPVWPPVILKQTKITDFLDCLPLF